MLHWSDEISRGMEKAQVANLPGVIIILVWLIGALLLAGRRSGYIITLLGGIVGVGVLVLHMQGAGIAGGRIANTQGIFFWAVTLITLGVASALSAILSIRGLWLSLRRR
jgi:hypothetical protein